MRADAGELLDPVVNARARDGYAAIGLLPPDIDLTDELVELTAREAAGIYSPRTRTLYVVDPESDPDTPAMLSLVVVHELVHALQHQHFPEPMQRMTRLRAHDDVTTALSALLEGDASLTMFAVLSPAARSLAVAQKARPLLYSEAAKPGTELALAPRFLAISMVFPYADGTVLAARNFESGGNAGLDAALRDPPLSTLRVLYPEQRAPVEFVRLPLEELAARTASPPCSVGSENTVGAHALGVLLETDTDELRARPARRRVARRPLRPARLRREVGARLVHALEHTRRRRDVRGALPGAGARNRRAHAALGPRRSRGRRARRRGRHAGAARAGRVAARRERGARLRLVRGVALRRLLSRARLSRRRARVSGVPVHVEALERLDERPARPHRLDDVDLEAPVRPARGALEQRVVHLLGERALDPVALARELDRVQEVERQGVVDPEREVRERHARQHREPVAVARVSGDELGELLLRLAARAHPRELRHERAHLVSRHPRDPVAPVRAVEIHEGEARRAADDEEPRERAAHTVSAGAPR